MQPTPEEIIENLKAIVDKYEHPELFSFLDFYELHFDNYKRNLDVQSPACNGNSKRDEPRTTQVFSRNAVVSFDDGNGTRSGIIIGIDDDHYTIDCCGESVRLPIASTSFVPADARTLPIEYAIRGAWGDFARFRLKTLASYLHLAHHFDKMQSLSNSRTQILEHQIESTYRIVSSINPRFLIADEVGLGKTVEAGLVIKEFMIRHNYTRVMIIVPASLQLQWQQEMREKFNEKFVIIDNRTLARLSSLLPDRVIISLDFAKQERIKALLLKKKWDTLVFDEAHKLRCDGTTKTLAYTLAEVLCQKASVFLLLSATPFSGKLEELYFLVRLLNPSLLGSINRFTLDYSGSKKDDIKTKLSTVLIRRRKVDVGGFTKRLAKTVSFEFTDEEQALYDRTTEYIRTEYNRAIETRNNVHSFILTVYQKMLDSSSHAIVHTIATRIEHLEKTLDEHEDDENKTPARRKRTNDDLMDDSLTMEEIEDADILAKKIYSTDTIEEMKRELRSLREIHALASKIKVNKKGEILLRIVEKILRGDKKAKVLIFTQFARTQDYLVDLLKDRKVSVFNGRMDKKAKDRAVVEFQKETNILISTEAGGEGRNLQFCHYLVNYDLPWNPQKIEQRIGRLHRFGQTEDVKIFNFSTKDTIGARILDVLENKIKVFEDSIGATDTLLGYYEDEIDFNSMFMKFHSNPGCVESEIDKKLRQGKNNFKYLEELTAHRVCDFNLDAFYDATKRERDICNSLIRVMMEEYSRLPDSRLVVKKSETGDGLYRLTNTHTKELCKGYFDSRQAIEHPELGFFAFGNQFVDDASERMRETSFLGFASRLKMRAVARDAEIAELPSCEGMIFNFIVSFRGNRMNQSLIPVFVDREMVLDEENENKIVTDFLQFGFEEDTHCDVERFPRNIIEALYNRALLLLEMKITSRTESVKRDLKRQIGDAIPLLHTHYESIFSELEELLQVQKSKEHIYNLSTLKGLISRTENKIRQYKKQQETELERIRNIKFIHTSYTLLNCAILTID